MNPRHPMNPQTSTTASTTVPSERVHGCVEQRRGRAQILDPVGPLFSPLAQRGGRCNFPEVRRSVSLSRTLITSFYSERGGVVWPPPIMRSLRASSPLSSAFIGRAKGRGRRWRWQRSVFKVRRRFPSSGRSVPPPPPRLVATKGTGQF